MSIENRIDGYIDRIEAAIEGVNTLTAPLFAPGTAAPESAPRLSSGTLNTTPEAGAIEYLTNTPYLTPSALNRAVLMTAHIVTVDSDFTGANGTAVQPIFPAAQDRLTVIGATTYLFELFLSVTNGATTTTKGLAFDAGTCSFTSIRYVAIGQNAVVNANGAVQGSTHVDTAAITTIVATGTTDWWIWAKGIMRINAGGTMLPQFKFSADPTGAVLVKKDSFMTLTPIGSNVMAAVGNWS